MALNFPDSPSNGDTTTLNGVSYTYDSTKTVWVSTTGPITTVAVSDNAPATPTDGDMWFNSSDLKLYIRYNDGATSQWIIAAPAGPAGVAGPSGAGGSSVTSYANLAAFPSSGNTAGDFGFATDTKAVYIWDGTEWDRIYTDTNAVLEWTTAPPATADLASDGTATNQTVVASDPEGFPIEYSYDTNPSNQTQATISNTGGAFTITPSTTEANAGDFILRYKATDGLHSSARSTTYTLGFFIKPTVYTSAGNGSTTGASIASQTATSITFNMNTNGGSYGSNRPTMAGLELPYGKYYFEAVTTNSIDNDMFTLTTYDWATTPTASDGTTNSHGWIYNTAASVQTYFYTNDIGLTSPSGAAYAALWSLSAHANAESRMGIAYDSATNNWWMRLGQSGWMWGDPVAGTGGYNGSTAGVSNGTSHKFFLGTGSSSAGNYSFRVESQSLHQYSTPTGFTSL